MLNNIKVTHITELVCVSKDHLYFFVKSFFVYLQSLATGFNAVKYGAMFKRLNAAFRSCFRFGACVNVFGQKSRLNPCQPNSQLPVPV